MGAEPYTSREGLKDMAAATGNTKYYELVAMPLDKNCYVRGFGIMLVGNAFLPCKFVRFDWEKPNTEDWIEVVW